MFKRKSSKKKMMESSELGQRWSSQEQLEDVEDVTDGINRGRTDRFNVTDVIKELFDVPAPVLEMKSEAIIPEDVVTEYLPFAQKFLEWSFIFFLGYFGFSYSWTLFPLTPLSSQIL